VKLRAKTIEEEFKTRANEAMVEYLKRIVREATPEEKERHSVVREQVAQDSSTPQCSRAKRDKIEAI
jgi:hypothetical protein